MGEEIRLEGADRPFEPDELPPSMWPARFVGVGEHNPAELKYIMSKEHKPVPLDKDLPTGLAKRMMNLTQYGRRTPEGRLRSLQNLKRCVAMSDETNDITEVQQEPAPVKTQPKLGVPKIPAMSTTRGRALRLIMSGEEYKLYVETWNDWFKAHPDFNLIEDELDVHTICTETVAQFRIKLMEMRYPNRDFSEGYQKSFNRLQQARHNLDATRSKRISNAKSNNPTNVFNVAILAGENAAQIAEQKRRMAEQQESRHLEFLNGTVVRSEELAKAEE